MIVGQVVGHMRDSKANAADRIRWIGRAGDVLKPGDSHA